MTISATTRADAVTAPRSVVLVLADISGYTHFIRLHGLSVLHAEEIITELLDTVIGASEHPLRLSKLEGDAAFLYAEVPRQPEPLLDVLRQVRGFSNVFADRRAELVQITDGG